MRASLARGEPPPGFGQRPYPLGDPRAAALFAAFEPDEQIKALRMEFPEAIMISTRKPEDVKRVRDLVLAFFEREMGEESFLIPYSKSYLTGKIHEKSRVLSEDYEDEGTRVRLRGPKDFLEWLRGQV